jgi:hypothetical protein
MRAWLSDQRGASTYVQALILLAVLALGGASAFKLLAKGLGEKTRCTADAIAALKSGGCADSVAQHGVAFPGEAPPAPVGEGPGRTVEPVSAASAPADLDEDPAQEARALAEQVVGAARADDKGTSNNPFLAKADPLAPGRYNKDPDKSALDRFNEFGDRTNPFTGLVDETAESIDALVDDPGQFFNDLWKGVQPFIGVGPEDTSDAWKELGKDFIAYDEWKAGHYAKASGTVLGNVQNVVLGVVFPGYGGVKLARWLLDRRKQGASETPTSGETPHTRNGRDVHSQKADERRKSGDWDQVDETIKGPDGKSIEVPKRVDLKTGEPVGDRVQTTRPDAVSYERGEIVDDKRVGPLDSETRQQMIRYIEAYRQATGELPERIIIERYDPETGKTVGTEVYKPEDLAPWLRDPPADPDAPDKPR